MRQKTGEIRSIKKVTGVKETKKLLYEVDERKEERNKSVRKKERKNQTN